MLTGAFRAPCLEISVCAVIDCRLPFVTTLRANPPHFPFRPVSKILWRQGAIPLIVPFFCNLRISCRQVIKSRQHALVRTKRTAISRCSRTDSCLPLVTALTKPPYLLVGISGYLRGQQSAVLRRTPLGSQIGIYRSKIIFTLLASSTAAYGTGRLLF